MSGITLNFKDFAYGTVQTAPSPDDSGVTLVLDEGQGDDFPDAPFDFSAWPPDVNPLASNAEIGICTEKDGDELHITRAQRGTTARHIAAGWQIMNTIDAELLNEIITLASGADGDILDQVSIDSFSTTCGPSDTVEVNGDGIAPICAPDGDGSNPFVVSFVAPASGKVELWAEMEIFVEMFNLPSGIAWCFTDAETGETRVSPLQEVNVFADVFGDSEIDTLTRAIYHAFVDGLTPGDTYNWQLSGYTLSGSSAVDIKVNDGSDEGDPWGPAVVTVQGGGSGGGGDGGSSGLESVVAGDGIAVDDTDPLNPIISATGGGGGGGGDTTIQAAIHQATTINFDNANILTGIDVYDVEEGDIVLDIWVEILTNWDGTTPFMDVGTFDETSLGFFAGSSPGAIDATNEDTTTNGYRWRSWNVPPYAADLATNNNAYLAADGNQSRVAPFTITDGGHPIQVVVTQDGTSGGADPGSTQGQAIVHVLVVPAAGVAVGGSDGDGSGISSFDDSVFTENGVVEISTPLNILQSEVSEMTLPVAATCAGQTTIIKNDIGGDANIVADGTLPDTIEGVEGYVLHAGASIWVRSDGVSNWDILGFFPGSYEFDIEVLVALSELVCSSTAFFNGQTIFNQAANFNSMITLGQVEVDTTGQQIGYQEEPVYIFRPGAVDPVLFPANNTYQNSFWVKNASGGDITLNPDPTVPDTIEDDVSLVLADGDSVLLWADGSNNTWKILSSYGLG